MNSTAPDSIPSMLRRHHSPDEPVMAVGRANVNVNRFNLVQSTIGIIALIFASVSLGFVLMEELHAPIDQSLQQQTIDAKIEAGIAKAEATAHAADTNARVALDKVQNVKVELAKRGINIKDD